MEQIIKIDIPVESVIHAALGSETFKSFINDSVKAAMAEKIDEDSINEKVKQSELCKRLKISRPTVRSWRKKGILPAPLILNKRVFYDWNEVLECLEKAGKR